jgi:hypothetical protein
MSIKIPQEYLLSEYDFGFTAVDEGEVVEPIITDVRSANSEELENKLQIAVDQYNNKLQQVEKLIIPLLLNLLKDADTKEYIKWPNRKPVIEKQIEKILAITRS